MKTSEFQNALTNVSDKYLEEAATYKRPAAKAVKVWRAIAIAACAVLAVSVSIVGAALLLDGSSSGKIASGGYQAETSPAMSYEGKTSSDSYTSGGSNYAYDVADSAAEGFWEPGEATVNDSESVYEPEYPETNTAAADRSSAKIIYTADISMQSTEFDDTVKYIDDLAARYDAYFESRIISDSSGSYRSADYIIRVPQQHYSELMTALNEGTAAVTRQVENAMDVSDSYYDIQSRLDTARTKLARLQALLAQAEDMSDIITLEDAISDTEWEIDDLQGALNSLDSKISYSTVNISLREVYKVNITDPAPLSFGERISQAFHNGLEEFGDAMGDLAIFFAESWTWILFLLAIHGIVFLIIFLIIRGAIRRHHRRNS